MKKLVSSLLSVMALAAVSTSPARAAVIQPALMSCHIEGNLAGLSIGVIFGGELLKGDGQIVCVNPITQEVTAQVPVAMKVIGAGVGLDLSVIEDVQIRSIDVMVANPALLEGSFRVGASAGATLIDRGADVDAAVKLMRQGAGFEVALTGRDAIGLGAHLYGKVFSVKVIR